jgi:Gas vesicle synthesis protein GvpL/GvpF
MIHLYGLVQDLAELPAVSGVDGAALERRRIAGLDVVVSQSERASHDVTNEAVLAHANVVEELMTRGSAVLPARFGRAFTSEEELSDAVQAKASGLEHGLTRVRGCVEFGLRVLGDEPRHAGSGGFSGGEYMRARLAEATQRERLSDELHRPLALLARASARFGGASGDLLHAAYLVPAEKADEFREHVSRLETLHPQLTMVCTGPWPPYTFAEAQEEAYERPA